jgi:hypothetical protein
MGNSIGFPEFPTTRAQMVDQTKMVWKITAQNEMKGSE